MYSNDHQESASSSFKTSLRQYVFEQEAQSPLPRRSLRQQQLSKSMVVSADTSESEMAHPQVRKRKSRKDTHSILEAPTSPSKGLARSPKRKKGYAPPEEFAHLRELNDCIRMHLDVLFVGINPGVLSATIGHHFAHPSNRFYKALHGSGLTDERVAPTEDYTLPDRYNIGITFGFNQLMKTEFRESTPALLQKIAKYRPRIVCFVGMGMYVEVEKVFDEMIAATNPGSIFVGTEGKSPRKRGTEKLAPGLRPYKVVYPEGQRKLVKETLFFSSPSTSGLAASYQEGDIIKLYGNLRELVSSHIAESVDTSKMQIVAVQHQDS